MNKYLAILGILIAITLSVAGVGYVVDTDGGGLEGVEIRLSFPDTVLYTDNDGKYSIENAVYSQGVTLPQRSNKRYVVNKKLLIETSSETFTEVRVANFKGQELFSRSFFTSRGINTIDLSFLSSGIYLLEINDKNGREILKFNISETIVGNLYVHKNLLQVKETEVLTAQYSLSGYRSITKVLDESLPLFDTVVLKKEYDFFVTNEEEFIQAIQSSSRHNSIYLKPGIDIFLDGVLHKDSLGNTLPITIDKPLKFISGTRCLDIRSDTCTWNNGATISWNTPGKIMFSIKSDSVTFKGISFNGNLEIANNLKQDTYGLAFYNAEDCHISQCEFTGFSASALYFSGGNKSCFIDSSYIHDNMYMLDGRWRWCYGILVTDGAFVNCSNMFFKNNFHDIAGSGVGKPGYKVINSTFISNGVAQNLDMHGMYHHTKLPNDISAGDTIIIDSNTFYLSPQSAPSIFIRGIPDSCSIKNNLFISDSIVHDMEIVWQGYVRPSGTTTSFFSGINMPLGNIYMSDNMYSNSDSSGLYILLNGSGSWRKISNYSGNYTLFNIKKTIPFTSVSCVFYLSDLKSGRSGLLDRYTGHFSFSNIDFGRDVALDNVQFGDINGDGVDEIVVREENKYLISDFLYHPGAWEQLQIVGDSLFFCNFNGDEYDDILIYDSVGYKILFNESSETIILDSLDASPTDIHLGDFDGDGSSDIFTATDSKITFYYGKDNWNIKKSIDLPLKGTSICVGRFDADSVSDILVTNGDEWYVVDIDNTELIFERKSEVVASEMVVGDFDRNGIDDLLILK